MFTSLRYLASLVKHPSRRDYIRMGFGIESRYMRCFDYWKSHLRCTREFLMRCERGESKSVVILGAGRLLDVDLDWLGRSFEAVHLVDYDPSCRAVHRRFARRYGSKVHSHAVDVTGAMESWTSHLHKVRYDSRRIAEIVERLDLPPRFPEAVPEGDLVVSLNLLSQIPLYWRDRVEHLVRPRGVDAWLEAAIVKSQSLLQERHLQSLETSHARQIALVTDTEFCYYRRDQAEWQVEEALAPPVRQRLSELDGYEVSERDAWLWHLVPQGEEASDYGEIHRVEALVFRRASRTTVASAPQVR